jgi:hypothetical protein
MMSRILFVVILAYLSCFCTCTRIYDRLNNMLILDNIYENNLKVKEKISQQDSIYLLDNQTRNKHHHKKLVKRGSNYSTPISILPPLNIMYDFQPKMEYIGYGLPVISKQKFCCNLKDGCSITFKDTLISSTAISMNADINIPLTFGSLTVSGEKVDTKTTEKACEVTWKLNFGDSGAIGLYPLMKFSFGKTIRTKERIYMNSGGYSGHVEQHHDEYETCVQTPIIGKNGQTQGIESFFYN